MDGLLQGYQEQAFVYKALSPAISFYLPPQFGEALEFAMWSLRFRSFGPPWEDCGPPTSPHFL